MDRDPEVRKVLRHMELRSAELLDPEDRIARWTLSSEIHGFVRTIESHEGSVSLERFWHLVREIREKHLQLALLYHNAEDEITAVREERAAEELLRFLG